MFYEFRELTPIGRRGDEMIRRLADRLVAVDLLDQAAELLQYQVDKRLEGSARAQVAAKLAMVYLANRKPDLAITALRSTRIADLSGELRAQRLLLEARAQSDVGRHDLAIDIVSNITGREAIRLRSDIYWAARRWRESSEQIELYYGDRWRDFKPLNPAEKSDVIRAVVGYALADDAIGMARFREKYAPLMSGETDKLAFDAASKPRRGQQRRFRRDRQDGRERRYARRLPARNEGALPRRSRAATGGRSGADRLAAADPRKRAPVRRLNDPEWARQCSSNSSNDWVTGSDSKVRRSANARNSATRNAANDLADGLAAFPPGKTACISTEPMSQSDKTWTSEPSSNSLRQPMLAIETRPRPATAAAVATSFTVAVSRPSTRTDVALPSRLKIHGEPSRDGPTITECTARSAGVLGTPAFLR